MSESRPDVHAPLDPAPPAGSVSDALRDLCDAVRSSIDARQHTAIINALAEADAALSVPASPAGGQVPEGWALVPKVLTEEMQIALYLADDEPGDSYRLLWDALLAAAPPPPADQGGAS